MSSTTANLLAYEQSTQTDFPKDVGVDKACQTDFPDISYFRSIKKEAEAKCEDLSDVIGSSTTTETSKYTSEDYEPDEDEESSEAEEESDYDEETDQDELSDSESVIDFEVDLQKEDQWLMCELTISLMEQNLAHYTGINKESAYVVDVIVEKAGISKRNVMLVLRKIRHNESFQILGHANEIYSW